VWAGNFSREERVVIHLTRLNSQAFAVNSDLIKFIENAPDTVLTLTSGEKIIVRESTEEVVERIIAFRRAVLAGLFSVGNDPNLAAAAIARREVPGPTNAPVEGRNRG
jgi:flagellar protein FlbD